MERERVVPYVMDIIIILVPYVIDIIIIHMNPEGDGECESSDTEDRSNCSSSVDMDL